MLLMKDRSYLYELTAYLIYVKVGERTVLYELRAYLIHVKVGEKEFNRGFTVNGQGGNLCILAHGHST